MPATPLQDGWPDNEPEGLTQFFHSEGDSLDFGAGWEPSEGWTDSSRIRVVEDTDSKHGYAIEKRSKIGDTDGWLGALNVAQEMFNVRELYIRMVWAVSDNWQFHRSGYDKLFLYGRFVDGSSPTQFVITQGGPGVRFTNQATSGDAAVAGTFQDRSLPQITRGIYHTVEVHHVLNSPGQADGSIRIWMDDEELDLRRMGDAAPTLQAARWIGWDENRFNGLQLLLYWGGGEDVKRVNDWIRLSELYISGR